jgi:quercetin dioxygenase-like cupin family protein
VKQYVTIIKEVGFKTKIKINSMTFINFNARNRIKIWEGISGPVYHSKNITFGHFTLEKDVELPEHSHPHEQWSHVIKGKLEFTIEGETEILTPGMTAFIPSNIPHCAKAITESKVIDCFLPVREDFVEKENDYTSK